MASKNVIELKPVKKKQNSSNEVSQPISLNDELKNNKVFLKVRKDIAEQDSEESKAPKPVVKVKPMLRTNPDVTVPSFREGFQHSPKELKPKHQSCIEGIEIHSSSSNTSLDLEKANGQVKPKPPIGPKPKISTIRDIDNASKDCKERIEISKSDQTNQNQNHGNDDNACNPKIVAQRIDDLKKSKALKLPTSLPPPPPLNDQKQTSPQPELIKSLDKDFKNESEIKEVLPELRKDRKKKLPTSPPPLPPIDSNESQALLESNATPKIKDKKKSKKRKAPSPPTKQKSSRRSIILWRKSKNLDHQQSTALEVPATETPLSGSEIDRSLVQIHQADDYSNDDDSEPIGERILEFLKSTRFLFFPILSWFLYHMDLYSDLFFATNLYMNCHFYYCITCVSIMIFSYITTTVYVKYEFNRTWFNAMRYPWEYEHNSWEHLRRCCIAISKGRPIPQMDQKAREFNRKVAFMEAITEATMQLCLSCLVLREYGISSIPHTKILQLTSLISSLLSICYAFVMRQNFVVDIKTPKFECSPIAFCKWLFGMISFVMFLCLPIIVYLALLFFLAIWRNCLDLLSIVLVLLIHPWVSIPIGIFAKAIGCGKRTCSVPQQEPFQSRTKSCYANCLTYLNRLFTLSINLYFAFIGAITLFLLRTSIDYRKASSTPLKSKFDYKDQMKFERCGCIGNMTEVDEDCLNPKEDFSNAFIEVTQTYLSVLILAFIGFCVLVHLVLSFSKKLPPPTPLFDFICGRTNRNDTTVAIKDEHGLGNSETTKQPNPRKRSFTIFCCILALIYILALFLMPFSYGYLFEEVHMDVNNVTWQCTTIESNLPCIFPFKLNDRIYHGCTKQAECAIKIYPGRKTEDHEPISIGKCGNTCPGVCTLRNSKCNIWGTEECPIKDGTPTCICRPGYEPSTCNTCEESYHRDLNFTQNMEIGEGVKCLKCNCNVTGSIGVNCTHREGQCDCKKGYSGLKCSKCAPNVDGPNCGKCKDGYESTEHPNCQNCSLHVEGPDCKLCDSKHDQKTWPKCDKCRPEFKEPNCTECAEGYSNPPECNSCDLNVVSHGKEKCGQCALGYGKGSSKFLDCTECKDNVIGDNCSRCEPGYFNWPKCDECHPSIYGNGSSCNQCKYGTYDFPSCFDCGCNIEGSNSPYCDNSGKCQCIGNFTGDKCDQCGSEDTNFPYCKENSSGNVMWRGTNSCDGARNSSLDKEGYVRVKSHWSGYCECAVGRVKLGKCLKLPSTLSYLNCEEACKECVGWVQTSSCDQYGQKIEDSGKGCGNIIERGWSGYCQCQFGNVMYKGCSNATYSTCQKACELAGFPPLKMRLFLSNNATSHDKYKGLYVLSKEQRNKKPYWVHKAEFYSVWWDKTNWVVGRYEDNGTRTIQGPKGKENWPINIRQGWTYLSKKQIIDAGTYDITFEDWSKIKVQSPPFQIELILNTPKSTFIKKWHSKIYELGDGNVNGHPYWIQKGNNKYAIWFGNTNSNWKIGNHSQLGSAESGIEGPHGNDQYPNMIGRGWTYKVDSDWQDAGPSEIIFRVLPKPIRIELILNGKATEIAMANKSAAGMYYLSNKDHNGYPSWIREDKQMAIWMSNSSLKWMVGLYSSLGSNKRVIEGPEEKMEYPTQISSGWRCFVGNSSNITEPAEIIIRVPPPIKIELVVNETGKIIGNLSRAGIYHLGEDEINKYPYWINKTLSNAIWMHPNGSHWNVGSISDLKPGRSDMKGPNSNLEYPSQIPSRWSYFGGKNWHNVPSTDTYFKVSSYPEKIEVILQGEVLKEWPGCNGIYVLVKRQIHGQFYWIKKGENKAIWKYDDGDWLIGSISDLGGNTCYMYYAGREKFPFEALNGWKFGNDGWKDAPFLDVIIKESL